MNDTIYDGFMAYIYDFCPYFGKWRPDVAKHYLSQLEHAPSRTVLELGTSTGLLTLPVAELNFSIDTVDYSKDMHYMAQKKLSIFCVEKMQKVNFILADITKYKSCKKYGAIMIPDSLLTVIPEDSFHYVLQMCYEALERDGMLLFDIFKPVVSENTIQDKKYSDAARFRDKDKNVYVVEADHEINVLQQIQISTYNYKKRIKPNTYMDVASTAIVYHYKYLPQIVAVLNEVGFSGIEIKEIFDGSIYFIAARKHFFV